MGDVSGFGKRLSAVREAAGLTRARLAARAGVSYAYIRQLETGERSVPRGDRLAAMASALGVTTDELLANDSPPPPNADRQRAQDDPRAKLMADLINVCANLDDATLEAALQTVKGFAQLSRSRSAV